MRISALLSEGYVQRNGAAMKLGSLRLHFYPNHVFYVDGRLDLSIYRDGAFKPPRSNEVYLKDAARLGIPKDFFTIVSYWLNTPVQKQDELLPRIEAALNHIAEKHLGKKEDVNEALLSPRVHEIFLKGLVGALLSGGFSLGLDYAKEKTADLDKAGLQAVYKSIDPREYPELTKKLTPQDRKGLDAILGKLKEHAMRMEEITEGNLEEMPSPRAMGRASRTFNVDKQYKMRGQHSPKSYKQPGTPSKADLSALAAQAKADWDKKKGLKEEDHEASMAKGQLYNACKNAMALMKMIEDGDNLEGWVAAKITKAADYLNAVHDYMAYEEVSEGKQRLDPKCWKGYRKAGTKMKGGVRVNNCVKVKK